MTAVTIHGPGLDAELAAAVSAALLVSEELLDGAGQGQVVDLALGESLGAQGLPDLEAGHVHEGERPRLKTSQVPHGDLTVPPHSTDYNVKFLSPEPGVRVAEVVALHDEGQGPLVHVQHHQELVRNLEGLVWCEAGWVGDAGPIAGVVVGLVAAQVPAPRLVILPDQRLISD